MRLGCQLPRRVDAIFGVGPDVIADVISDVISDVIADVMAPPQELAVQSRLDVRPLGVGVGARIDVSGDVISEVISDVSVDVLVTTITTGVVVHELPELPSGRVRASIDSRTLTLLTLTHSCARTHTDNPRCTRTHIRTHTRTLSHTPRVYIFTSTCTSISTSASASASPLTHIFSHAFTITSTRTRTRTTRVDSLQHFGKILLGPL